MTKTMLFRSMAAALMLGILSLPGCSNSTGSNLPQSACSQPRPQACTMQYNPVCGILRDDTRKTYSNRCVACSNLEVIATTPGACPGARE